MTEEEKKAIEKIKLDISKPLACKGITICDVDDLIKLLKLIEKLQSDIEIKDKVIDLLIDDVYDNDNFWKLKCGFERIEKGKEKEYIKERFYKKAEEENE